MAKVLVIRFSAIGDVAMIIPVIYSFAAKYTEHQVTVLSRSSLKPLFIGAPGNVDFIGVDFDAYKGIGGLNRLYKELRNQGFEYVIDLNCVLRSLFLAGRFMFDGRFVSIIHKDKRGQKQLTRRNKKRMMPLKTTFQRYQEAFTRLGFTFKLNFKSIFDDPAEHLAEIDEVSGKKASDKWIGIAPFAKHQGKIYPMGLQEQVVAHFANKDGIKVFLFGGGEKEKALIDGWVKKYPSVCSVIGKLDMRKELILMGNLDVMLSMDSANMHFASLTGTPVVSVWGATHPHSGFLGWRQKEENAVQIPLDCRPCSAHGTEPCYKGTWQCLHDIHPSMVIKRIESVLSGL